jgi:hypothetical protein
LALHISQPAFLPEALDTALYIFGGVILLISFLLFVIILTFLKTSEKK